MFAAGNDNDDGNWYPAFYGGLTDGFSDYETSLDVNDPYKGAVAVASTDTRLDRSSF